MEDTGKLEERNKIVSELQTIIKERIELKEIEIPGTITFQVMSHYISGYVCGWWECTGGSR